MNKKTYKQFFSAVFLMSTLLGACKDPWKDRSEVIVQTINQTVLDAIASNPDLSKFHELLKASGLDKTLLESRTFTVWAPDNKALENLSQTITGSRERLVAFLENHIAYQTHFTKDIKEATEFVSSLNGKKVRFQKNSFDGNAILKADQYYKNGVLHIVNGYTEPKPNAFEYLLSLNNEQAKYIQTLEYKGLDVSKGVILYYDPVTKEPVYQDGTTFEVQKNRLFEKISNIASEDSLLTYVILTDAAFDYEKVNLKRFNARENETEADSLTKWHIVKDLVFNGIQEGIALNDSLKSISGVQIKINPGDIVETKQLSNGIAYVVNKLNYKLLENKVPTITIQGAMVDSLRVPARTSTKILRDFNGQIYMQIETPSITSSPSPLYYFRYKTTGYSTKYAIYARARNTVLTVPFAMAVAVSGNRNNVSEKPKSPYFSIPVYDALNPNTFKEIYVGETDVLFKHKDLYVYLLSSEGATSAAPTALALNYLKFVPIN